MDFVNTISCLLEHIREEIEDCDTYTKLAMKYKDNDKTLYGLYSDLASQEYVHYQLIISQAQRIFKENQIDDTGERIIEWQFENLVNSASEVKRKLDICKS